MTENSPAPFNNFGFHGTTNQRLSAILLLFPLLQKKLNRKTASKSRSYYLISAKILCQYALISLIFYAMDPVSTCNVINRQMTSFVVASGEAEAVSRGVRFHIRCLGSCLSAEVAEAALKSFTWASLVASQPEYVCRRILCQSCRLGLG